MQQELEYMREAIRLSQQKMREGHGGPFGAVIVREKQIIARGFNSVLSTNDPTAHAEVVAIREACRSLNQFHLEGCQLYTSCEPCPMCLGAIYWAHLDIVFFANRKEDAAQIGFDDQFIYQQIEQPFEQRSIPMINLGREEALAVFTEWKQKEDKTLY